MFNVEKPAGLAPVGPLRAVQPTAEHTHLVHTDFLDQRPDHSAIMAHLTHLFCDIDSDLGLIEVAWSAPTGKALNQAQLFETGNLQRVADRICALNQTSDQNVYFAAGLRAHGSDPAKRGNTATVTHLTAVWADFDDEGEAERALDIVRDWGMPPTFVVQTGCYPFLRAQFWWKLTHPTSRLAEAKALMTDLAKHLNGDKSVPNVDRLMRAAGTIAWPKKLGRIKEVTGILRGWIGDGQPYDIDDLIRRLPVAVLPVDIKPANRTLQPARRTTQAERIEKSRLPGQWHCNIRDYVAHAVQGGANAETILALAPLIKLDGYTLEQTRWELQQLVLGFSNPL